MLLEQSGYDEIDILGDNLIDATHLEETKDTKDVDDDDGDEELERMLREQEEDEKKEEEQLPAFGSLLEDDLEDDYA